MSKSDVWVGLFCGLVGATGCAGTVMVDAEEGGGGEGSEEPPVAPVPPPVPGPKEKPPPTEPDPLEYVSHIVSTYPEKQTDIIRISNAPVGCYLEDDQWSYAGEKSIAFFIDRPKVRGEPPPLAAGTYELSSNRWGSDARFISLDGQCGREMWFSKTGFLEVDEGSGERRSGRYEVYFEERDEWMRGTFETGASCGRTEPPAGPSDLCVEIPDAGR
ncbi:MAG: hypothetical protein AAGA56_11755 [Myxococcota bacterium]